MAYVRKVRTASGAVAVQVVRKDAGKVQVIAHVGSAHTDAELGILLEKARQLLDGDQEALDFEAPVRAARVGNVADYRQQSLPVDTGGPAPCPPRTAINERVKSFV